jgi:hypothetical protein
MLALLTSISISVEKAGFHINDLIHSTQIKNIDHIILLIIESSNYNK